MRAEQSKACLPPHSVCHSDMLSGGEGGVVAFINIVVLAVVLGRCVIIVGAAAAADAHDSSQSRRRTATPTDG